MKQKIREKKDANYMAYTVTYVITNSGWCGLHCPYGFRCDSSDVFIFFHGLQMALNLSLGFILGVVCIKQEEGNNSGLKRTTITLQ